MSASRHLAVWLLCLLVAGCGGDTETSSGPPDPDTAGAPALEVRQPGLALGITEPNPAFVWSEEARPAVSAPFAAGRDVLDESSPSVYRLMVNWRAVAPERGRLDFDAPQSGCLRDAPPCSGWGGVREQLAGLASRQAAGGGWEGMVVIWDTPDWAAAPASPCEPPGTEARSRPPAREALPRYRALIRGLVETAESEGARIRFWSPWNEPNHPYFLGAQHDPCDDPGSTPSVTAYVALVRAMDAELARMPGSERVLGELAGVLEASPRTTSVSRFTRALPRDVVCGSRVWAQHAYGAPSATVDAAWSALRGFSCPAGHRIWITETGAGTPHADLSGNAAGAAGESACRAYHRMLGEWWRDERVDVAIQYTLREDDLFRVGLLSTGLDASLPAMRAWRAWSGRPDPHSPPPPSPCRP